VAQTQRKTLQPLSETGRWIRALVGVGAAMATILASAHSCGLIGDQSSRITLATLAVNWVGLAPAVDTAESLGDTLRYVATVTDRRGTALVGAAIVWTSENPMVATVDSAGFVVARRPGITSVVATVGDRVARARIVVRPRVARLDLGADSVLRVPEGGRVAVQVRAVDARGHELTHGRPGLRASDTSLIAIDTAGGIVGRLAGRTALIALVDGVSDSTPVDVVPVPGRIVAIKGNDQHLGVNARLPEPVVVRVESRRGRPLAGVGIRFTPAEGSGSVGPDSVVTGGDGLARVTWTLGETPGRQRVIAAVSGLDSLLTVYAEAEPSASNTRVAALDDGLSAPAGDGSVVAGVRVTDSLGRLLAGVPIVWTALDGTIKSRAARTDSLGESRAEWYLGHRSGTQRAKALVGNGRSVPAFVVTATALPGDAAILVPVHGTLYEGTVGKALEHPVMVRVTDSAGNAVADVTLRVSPKAGGVPDSSVKTDAAGRATIRWTLGETAGDQKLAVTGAHMPSLEITARARARAAANVAFLESSSGTSAGRASIKAVKVRVTDVYGNPVGGQLVAFRASAGTVTPKRVMTAKDGTASAKWTLSRQSSAQAISASLPGSTVQERLAVEAPAPTRTSAPVPSPTPRQISTKTRRP
jgi:hypothetical protein